MSPQKLAAVLFGNGPEQKWGRLLTQAFFANTACMGLPHLSPDTGKPISNEGPGQMLAPLPSVLHLGRDLRFCPGRLGCGVLTLSVGLRS